MSSPLFDLTGRLALVTGGGTHLGRAMARSLASHGAHVYVAGRRVALVEESARIITADGGLATPIALDITDTAAVESALDAMGEIDILVANAGASNESQIPPNTDIDVFRATLDSHLVGTLITANAAARRMLPKQRGSIITVSSVHGSLAADPRLYAGLNLPRRSTAAYQSAKAAIIGLTRNLAAEFGRSGLRVNCISPGHIPKPEANPDFVARLRDGNAMGIVGQPEDLQGAVLLLASDAGRFITGHNLVVDGGWSIW